MLFHKGNQIFVGFTRKHHLNHFHGLGVGVTQAVDKTGFNAHLLQGAVDVGAAAVHQHHLDADEVKQNDITHNAVLQMVVDHSVSAVFYHNIFAVVFLNVGQGVYNNRRLGLVGNGVRHGEFLLWCILLG